FRVSIEMGHDSQAPMRRRWTTPSASSKPRNSTSPPSAWRAGRIWSSTWRMSFSFDMADLGAPGTMITSLTPGLHPRFRTPGRGHEGAQGMEVPPEGIAEEDAPLDESLEARRSALPDELGHASPRDAPTSLDLPPEGALRLGTGPDEVEAPRDDFRDD